MTDLTLSEHGLTIRDQRGSCLMFDRHPDGSITSWIADESDGERFSRALSTDDRLRIVAFLSRGLS